MLPGFGLTVGAIAVGALPADQNFGRPDPFAAITPGDTDLTYLLEVFPFDPAFMDSLPGPPLPVGVAAQGDFDYSFRGGRPGVYLGDHHNYVSHAGDSPAHTLFRGRLDPAYSMTARLGSPQDPLGGAAVDVGDIGIGNADGSFDDLLQRSWGGILARVKVGKDHWSYGDFADALVGNIVAPRAQEATRINLVLTTVLKRLDQPIRRSYYTGLGGAGGDAHLKDVPVPECFGFRRSVEGRQISRADNVFQFCRAAAAMTNARDKGVPMGPGSGLDYPDYAALAAAPLDPGEYATCIAEGLARYGSTVFLPTFDIEGPAAIGNLAGGIVLAIAQGWLGSGLDFAAGMIEPGAFARLDLERPVETGFFVDGETPARTIIDQVMRDVLAAAISTRDGLLSCVMYAVPGIGPSEITAADIDTAGIALTQRVPAARRVTVTYAPRQRVLGPTEMDADAVSAEDRQDLGAPAQYVTATRSPVDADARDIVITTGLRHQADAQAMAEIAADLLSTFTHYYDVPLVSRPFLHWLADARRLTYARFGNAGGRSGVIVGLNESNQGGAVLTLWMPGGV